MTIDNNSNTNENTVRAIGEHLKKQYLYFKRNKNMEFDTLEYTERAVAIGIPRAQAEFHARETAELLNQTVITRATLKQELSELEIRMRSFHYQISGTILGGTAAIITILESILHFLWSK